METRPLGNCDPCNRIGLERLHLDEGRYEDKRATILHILECPLCRDRLDALFNEQRAYLAVHPFSGFAARRPAPPSRAESGIDPRWQYGLAAMAAGLILLAVIEPATGPGTGAAIDAIRCKSSLELGLKILRKNQLLDPDRAYAYQAGDALQFFFSPGRYAYVTLVSLDVRGHVSTYKSETEKGIFNSPAQSGRAGSFPFSVQLDDSPGYELFVLTAGHSPLDEGKITAGLEKAFLENDGDIGKVERSLAPSKADGIGRVLLLVPKESS
jgi:hypothetical protein